MEDHDMPKPRQPGCREPITRAPSDTLQAAITRSSMRQGIRDESIRNSRDRDHCLSEFHLVLCFRGEALTSQFPLARTMIAQ